MARTAIIYGSSLATGALLLRWLEYTYTLRILSAEIYAVAIALAFSALGLWVGRRLTAPKAEPFEKNDNALRYLGISEREYQVLALLAAGFSNREIGDKLFVSPNTVKTHLAHLYAKLEVSRRTQAVRKGRELRLIP